MGYRFKIENENTGRDAHLICKAGLYQLRVYLELSGVPEHSFVCSQQDFETWTWPPGKTIQADVRTDLIAQLHEWWATQSELTIGITPRQSTSEFAVQQEAQAVAQGYTIEHLPDGSTVYNPPNRS